MDLNTIQAFVAVARAGSFTGASKRLSLPKSTVSRQVSRLEERLGVQLLHRTTRSLSLTEAGRGYYARCLHAIEEIEEAERFALDQGDRPSGTLRVALTYDMCTIYLTPILPEFRRMYPDVRLDLDMSNRSVDLVREGYDVALRGGIMRDSSLIARRITHSRLILAASPAYLEERGRPAEPADLREHDGLLLSQITAGSGLRLKGPGGWAPMPLEPWLQTNDFSVLQRMAIADMGIALLEDNLCSAAIRAGRLEAVLPDYSLGEGGGLFAVYPATHHLTPKVRAFVDFIAERIAPLFAADA